MPFEEKRSKMGTVPREPEATAWTVPVLRNSQATPGFTRLLHGLLIGAVTFCMTPRAHAQEPVEPAQISAAIDQLLSTDPAALVARLAALRDEAAAQAEAAAAARAEADAIAARQQEAQARLDALLAHVTALGTAIGGLVTAETAEAMKAEAAEAATAAAMKEAQAAMTPAADFKNFNDHVKPLLEAHCMDCHNLDRARGGLSMSTYASILQGGSSGAVITKGDPDGSRLFRLITHQEEPVMPPSGDKIPVEAIELLRAWIAAGAPENAESTPMAMSAPAPAEEMEIFVAASFDGPPPVPEAPLAEPHLQEGRGVVARAVAPSGRAPIAATGGDRQVLLYDVEAQQLLGALPFPEGDIFSLTFSVNGALLLAGGGQAGDQGIVALYDVRTGARTGTYGQYYDTVLASDISPDHTMIAAGGPNNVVRVYEVGSGEVRYALDKHTDWIQAVKFTPDGEVLATGDRAGNLYLWQAANGRPVEELRGHEGAIHAMAYTYDSALLVTAGADGTVQVWDTWEFKRVRSFSAHSGGVLNVDVSKDGHIVTTGVDNKTKLWDLEGTEIRTLAELPDWGYQAKFAWDAGFVLAGSWDGAVRVVNTESGETVATWFTNPAAG
jgi:hypothetical protein